MENPIDRVIRSVRNLEKERSLLIENNRELEKIVNSLHNELRELEQVYYSLRDKYIEEVNRKDFSRWCPTCNRGRLH